MKESGKWLVALGLVIAAAVVVSMVVRASPEIILPNGTEVRYLGTVRADQAFSTERWIERMGRRYLPAVAQGWIPEAWSSDPMSLGWSNSIAIQLLVKGPPNNMPRLPRPLLFVAEDAFGYRFRPAT